MTKNTIIISTLLLTLAAAAQAASVYECTDASGRKVYTETGGKHCKTQDLGKPQIYSAAPAPAVRHGIAPDTMPSETPSAHAAPDLAAAEAALAQARKNLDDGKAVRYGNERNYARYLERIGGLEKQVKAAQAQVEAARDVNNGSSQAIY